LYKSFSSEPATEGDGVIEVSIESPEYNEYGRFVDYGVTGKGFVATEGKKTWKHYKSINGYSFKDKMPPPDRFKTDKLLRPVSDGQAFATAMKIYQQGIEPKEFFIKPFESNLVNLPDKIIEAFGIDLDNYLNEQLNGDLQT
jgi:hypothetical protein